MRILQALGWYYPENLGGTETYVSGLSKRLADGGHEVFIAAPLAGLSSPRLSEIEGLPVYRYPVPTTPTRDEAQGNTPARGSEFFRAWLAELKPDIAHFHSIVTGMGIHELRAAGAGGARVIMTSHASSLGYICQRGTLMRWGSFPCDGLTEVVKCAACELQHRGVPKVAARVMSREPLALSRIVGKPGTRVGTALGMPGLIARNQERQKELLGIVDRFVVLTRSAARIVELNGIPAGKLAVNPLGISASPAAARRPPGIRQTSNPVRLGYLGRFDPVKGVFDLANALKRLPASLGFQFEFRGPASTEADRTVLDSLRNIIGDDPRVTFAPAVSPSEVAGILESYDVLVCPSICAEGGPTVAIEAHAAGTPVIGTRIGGLAELVEDGINGRLVTPGSVRELATLLETIVNSPGETIERWRTALPAARTMEDVVEDYLTLYSPGPAAS
jgi:glycosyltransferase involved in cell wall biosynthesis